MRVVAIIQARMGSTRLPGKVLAKLGCETVLARVVKRTQRARMLNEVVVATSDLPSDDAIADECARLSIAYFRGSENDVLDRYYHAATEFGATAVVRITADCPFIAPELIDETISKFSEESSDYATNALVPTYPRGLDVEVFATEALSRAWREATLPYQRVHVTPYMYENPDLFRIASITADADYSRYRWTLDTPEDLVMIRSLCDSFGNNDLFGWRDVLKLIYQQPELAAINSHVTQKAVHEG